MTAAGRLPGKNSDTAPAEPATPAPGPTDDPGSGPASGRATAYDPPADGTAPVVGAPSLPHTPGPAATEADDPLDHPDPLTAADAAATEHLLRGYLRDTGTALPAAGRQLLLTLPTSGLRLAVPVRYRSPTGWHRLGRPRLAGSADGASGRTATDAAAPVGVGLLAGALIRETTAEHRMAGERGTGPTARVLHSASRVAVHLARRRAERADAPQGPFLESEQALLLGHPFHPAPKARGEATDEELGDWSPELRGRFPLHWFAAQPDVLVGTHTDRRLIDTLHALASEVPVPSGMLPVPAHPWQARRVLSRPEVADLLDAGHLRPLGPAGPAWYPTSSLRTVYRPDAPAMLKLSLGMRITNARRDNLRGELRLGVRASHLLAAEPGRWLRAAHPRFSVLRDSGWVSVGTEDGPETGLETAIRDNPFHGGPGDGRCVAGLLAERTGPGDGRPPRHRAELCRAVEHTARVHRIPVAEAAEVWLDRYLQVLARPLISLYARYGVAVEPHHQNTLVTLDQHGLPSVGWYRDSQGYYLAASRAAQLESVLPGLSDGLELVFDDALVEQRIGYYLGVANLLGLVGGFGALGLADEEDLLRVLRAALERLRHGEPGAAGLLDLLLEEPVLPCKGNYLTCVDGRDELVGEVATQSVYVPLRNPLTEV